MKITTDDILNDLREAMNTYVSEEGSTVAELCERTGKSQEPVRRAIKLLMAEGKWECIKVRRHDMSGRTSVVPGYRPKP